MVFGQSKDPPVWTAFRAMQRQNKPPAFKRGPVQPDTVGLARELEGLNADYLSALSKSPQEKELLGYCWTGGKTVRHHPGSGSGNTLRLPTCGCKGTNLTQATPSEPSDNESGELGVRYGHRTTPALVDLVATHHQWTTNKLNPHPPPNDWQVVTPRRGTRSTGARDTKVAQTVESPPLKQEEIGLSASATKASSTDSTLGQHKRRRPRRKKRKAPQPPTPPPLPVVPPPYTLEEYPRLPTIREESEGDKEFDQDIIEVASQVSDFDPEEGGYMHRDPTPTADAEVQASATTEAEELKERQGNMLLPLVRERRPELAGKITGMILELPPNEVEELIHDEFALSMKVHEAVCVLDAAARRAGGHLKDPQSSARVKPPHFGPSTELWEVTGGTKNQSAELPLKAAPEGTPAPHTLLSFTRWWRARKGGRKWRNEEVDSELVGFLLLEFALRERSAAVMQQMVSKAKQWLNQKFDLTNIPAITQHNTVMHAIGETMRVPQAECELRQALKQDRYEVTERMAHADMVKAGKLGGRRRPGSLFIKREQNLPTS